MIRFCNGKADFVLVAVSGLFVSGCTGVQSALDPRSSQASKIAVLWWVMLAIGTLIFLGVIALTAAAVTKRGPEGGLSPNHNRNLVLAGGVIIPVVVLTGLLIYSVLISRAITTEPPNFPVTVEIIGHQWWWEINYLDSDGTHIARTANEIHIPVGVPVRFILKSADVIHSFWVPNLHGKTDLIPGQINHSWFQAEAPGRFRGQCAEFCGLQHALMAFWVTVESLDEFEAWIARQREAAIEPTTATAIQGRDIFLSTSCVNCHTIRGTHANAAIGPDLTHVASRQTLGAGTLPNTRNQLEQWVRDPQRIKFGVLMPPSELDEDSFRAVIDYLESLK